MPDSALLARAPLTITRTYPQHRPSQNLVIPVTVKVKLRARESRLVPNEDGSFTAHVKSPPVDGKANEEVIGLVASHFGVSKSRVSIKSGATSKTKCLQVDAT